MEQIATGDIYLTSVLRLKGHTPARTAAERGRTTWLFTVSPDLSAVVDAYYNGRLAVSARDFAERIRSTKGEAVSRAREEVRIN